MATKLQTIEAANRGEGCLGKALSGEPVFILRAQDRFAPDVIEAWANKVELARGTTTSKIREARALAHEMRAWQEMNTCKIPD
jgi:hypothetical protein